MKAQDTAGILVKTLPLSSPWSGALPSIAALAQDSSAVLPPPTRALVSI